MSEGPTHQMERMLQHVLAPKTAATKRKRVLSLISENLRLAERVRELEGGHTDSEGGHTGGPPFSFVLEPIEIPVVGDEEGIEIIRGLAYPRLIVTVEGDTIREVFERIEEMNEGIQGYGWARLPFPDVPSCPACGQPVTP